jgi:hypothetical protein
MSTARGVPPPAGSLEEKNLVTFPALQEGDQFDKDIQRIMGIIGNVEKEFGEKRINKTFKTAVNSAYNKRLIQLDHDETVQETKLGGHEQNENDIMTSELK